MSIKVTFIHRSPVWGYPSQVLFSKIFGAVKLWLCTSKKPKSPLQLSKETFRARVQEPFAIFIDQMFGNVVAEINWIHSFSVSMSLLSQDDLQIGEHQETDPFSGSQDDILLSELV